MNNENVITYIVCVLLVIIFVILLFLPSNVVLFPIASAENEHAVQFITPELKGICACESVGDWTAEPKHWDSKGNVLRGRQVPDDIGACQINRYYHEATAKKMGIDIFSYNGNIKFANYLYEKNGTEDWSASRKCWDKNNAVLEKKNS